MKIKTYIYIASCWEKNSKALPIEEVIENFDQYASYLTVCPFPYLGDLHIEQMGAKLSIPCEIPAVFLKLVPDMFKKWQINPNKLNTYAAWSQQNDGDSFNFKEIVAQEIIEIYYEVIDEYPEVGRMNQKIRVDYWSFFELAFIELEKIITYEKCFIPYIEGKFPHTNYYENELNISKKIYLQKYAAYTLRKSIEELIEKKKNGHLLIREQTQLEYLQKIQLANTNIALDALLIEIQNIYGVDNETRKYILRICQTKINNLH